MARRRQTWPLDLVSSTEVTIELYSGRLPKSKCIRSFEAPCPLAIVGRVRFRESGVFLHDSDLGHRAYRLGLAPQFAPMRRRGSSVFSDVAHCAAIYERLSMNSSINIIAGNKC